MNVTKGAFSAAQDERVRPDGYFYKRYDYGEMPEWSNGAVLKTAVAAMSPGVRIPLSPKRVELHLEKMRGNVLTDD